MTSIGPSSSAKTQYSYRADGMRVKKVLPGGDVTRSYYDGQMPVEEDSVVTGNSSVTRNFVGARGIEAIFTTTTSGTTTAFPLYDCHGNMVATISRSGSGFVTSNVRTYDVWGGVRTGASTGGPKGRYVANLGHVQDDESGLIYMRARYYEPESGRFISEDPARDGSNWYVYAANNPSMGVDPAGLKAMDPITQVAIFGMILGFFSTLGMTLFNPESVYSTMSKAFQAAIVGFALGWFVATVGKMLGSEGLGARWPERLGGWKKGASIVAVNTFTGGVGLAIIGYISMRAGQILWYLFEMEMDGYDTPLTSPLGLG